MGDGFTDATRAERQEVCLHRYYTAIHAFLLDGTEPNREEVRRAAKDSDRADRNWDKEKSREVTCDALLDSLITDDESAWIEVLEEMNSEPLFDDLHKQSPFRNRILLYGRSVHYGCGIEMDMRQLQRFITRIAESRGGFGESFCISIPFPEPGTTRILKKK